MTVQSLLDTLGPEIEDPEEEAFLLFSQSIPSQNLGFVDSKATSLDLTIGTRDLIIHQSPTILSSNRSGGTTGAVVWKITPLFASWMVSSSNPIWKHKVLSNSSSALELGCGISGIIALVMAPLIRSYTLTDQEYVMKLLNQNILENKSEPLSTSSKGRKSSNKTKKAPAYISNAVSSSIQAKSLDWETDEVSSLVAGNGSKSFDVVIACDCIYNDALIEPLVQTCADACQLRRTDGGQEPTVCIIAQQLRSSEVFEAWLKVFHSYFRVWRLEDSGLIPGLQSNSGFIVHLGILREEK